MNCPTDSLVHIGIVENNVRALSAELECDVLQVGLRRSFHNLSSHKRASRERDLVYIRVFRNSRSSSVSEAVHDVYDAGREPGLLDKADQAKRSEWSEFARLENYGVPCSECWSDFPCEHHEREVPWDDLSADPDRFVASEGELAFVGFDDLALVLVCPTAEVPDSLD